MTETTSKILAKVILMSIAAIFISFLTFSLNRGDSIIYAVFGAIFMTICTIVLIVILYISWWRLFTKEGREAEKKAEERKRRIIRENLETWNHINRDFIRAEEKRTNREIDRLGSLERRRNYDENVIGWYGSDCGDCGDGGDGCF